jgi:hypothetical protein
MKSFGLEVDAVPRRDATCLAMEWSTVLHVASLSGLRLQLCVQVLAK